MTKFLRALTFFGCGVFLTLTETSLIWACDFRTFFPAETRFTLSNGVEIPLPSLADSYDAISIMGEVNLQRARELLAPEGLVPVEVSGKGMGVLSAFRYRASDAGVFNEAYFVILAARREPRSILERIHWFISLMKFNNSFTTQRQILEAPRSKIGMYHVAVFSSTETAALMSQEIWQIPSQLAQVDFESSPSAPGFALHLEEQPLLRVRLKPFGLGRNPAGHNLGVYAVGPLLSSGEQYWSYVQSCGITRTASFDRKSGGDVLWYDPATQLGHTLANLRFKPTRKEMGLNDQAVQFAPTVRNLTRNSKGNP